MWEDSLLHLASAAVKGIQNSLAVNRHLNRLADSDILERLLIKVHGKVHDTHTRALYDLIRISLGETVYRICSIIQIENVKLTAFKHHGLGLGIRNDLDDNTRKPGSSLPVILIACQNQLVVEAPGRKLKRAGTNRHSRIHAELIARCLGGLAVVNRNTRRRNACQEACKRLL